MGLDGVELILAVEDGFQIHIENEEAGRLSTVGDLLELVTSKLSGDGTKRCLTSAAFYRTRRGIMGALGLKRHEIRPSTRLEALFPENTRRSAWHATQSETGLRFPALEHSGAVARTFTMTGIIAGVAAGVAMRAGVAGLAFAALVGFFVGVSALRLAPGSAVSIPNGNETVGDLARDVLALNQTQFKTDAGAWNDGEVWETLCRIIVRQTGVERELITRDARIIDDLRID